MPQKDSVIQYINPQSPWLAPLAGYSDLPFRLLCRKYGAAVAETEMISAKGLLYNNAATDRLLATNAQDMPLVVQLFGSEPESIFKAARILRRRGFKYFDFNVGCPVRKVFKQHSGAALLADLPLLKKCAQALILAVKVELPGLTPGLAGFKLRAGVGPAKAALPDAALILEDLGADWLTIHPRYASQGYSGFADWQIIANLTLRVAIPILASGDLFSAKDGLKCIEQTGARGLMYARGALYNPAIFQDHQNLLRTGITEAVNAARTREIIREHIALSQKWDQGRHGFIKMRSLLPRYIRSIPGAQDMRRQICDCSNWEELLELVEKIPGILAKG